MMQSKGEDLSHRRREGSKLKLKAQSIRSSTRLVNPTYHDPAYLLIGGEKGGLIGNH